MYYLHGGNPVFIYKLVSPNNASTRVCLIQHGLSQIYWEQIVKIYQNVRRKHLVDNFPKDLLNWGFQTFGTVSVAAALVMT